MYNYYVYAKKEKEKENEEILKKRELKRVESEKRLVQNYEERVKKFIYKFSTKPYKIVKNRSSSINPREDLLKEESHKIINKKGIIFKEFETDKQRLEKFLKEKSENEGYDKKNKKPLTKDLNLSLNKSPKKNIATKKSLNKNKSFSFPGDDFDLAAKKEEIENNSSLSYKMYNHMMRKLQLELNGVLPKTKEVDDPILFSKRNIEKEKFKERNAKSTSNKTYFNAMSNFSIGKSFYNSQMIKKLHKQQLEEDKRVRKINMKTEGLNM